MKSTEIEWLKKMKGEGTNGPEQQEPKHEPVEVEAHYEEKKSEGGGFADVAGFDCLKTKIVKEFIRVIKHPRKASRYRVSPSNLLFYGPPGTGKTYFATKMAEEIGIPYMVVNPDDLGSTYIHGSQLKIRECFDKAIKKAPMILVFDEIDAIIPKREESNHNSQNGETNEFLAMLNDINKKKVYVVGMTNNLGTIDGAALRTGRFNQLLYFPMPDESVRESLFKYYLGKLPLDQDIDYAKLAGITAGYNCSDIEYMTQKASLEAFNMSIDLEDDAEVPITQSMMETIISEQRYSVSPEDLKRYEAMNLKYGTKGGMAADRRKVGFIN